MHAVVRTYSGSGAGELMDLLEERKAEIDRIIREVGGFVSYSVFRTDTGGASFTICKDKAGTDESVIVARDWIQKNAGDLRVSPPAISEGPVIVEAIKTH